MDQTSFPPVTHYQVKKGDRLRSMHPSKRLTQAGRNYVVAVHRVDPPRYVTPHHALTDRFIRSRLPDTQVAYLEALRDLDRTSYEQNRTVMVKPAEVTWVGASGYYFASDVEPGRMICDGKVVQ